MQSEALVVALTSIRGNARDALLAATGVLMTERETLDVSLSDIADRVGVTAAMVKYHFGNKNGLLMALLERDIGETIHALGRLANCSMNPASKMRKHLAALADAYMEHAGFSFQVQHPSG